MLIGSKSENRRVLAALAVFTPMAIMRFATAQCPPRYEVDVIQPTSCGIFDPAITAWGISSAGDLCGTRSGCGDTDGGPFAWFGEPPIVDIPEPPAYPLAGAYGVNSMGQVVGFMHSTGNSARRAFIYQNGVTTELGALPGHTSSEAFDLNDNRFVCGFSQGTFGPMSAVVWNSPFIIPLNLPLGPNSVANDILNNGLVCGWMGQGGSGVKHAFIYDLATNEAIDVGVPLASIYSAEATGLNTHGNICGWGFEPCSPGCGGRRGFFWTKGLGYDLGNLTGFPRCIPDALNDSNLVVGHCETSTGVSRAFVWQEGIMFALNDLIDPQLNLNVQIARDINNAGRIAASGRFNGGGAYVALRLNPVPPQPGDCTCDWLVNVGDIMEVIGNWGECPPQFTAPCTTDFNNDHRTGVPDLLHVINHWGQGNGLP